MGHRRDCAHSGLGSKSFLEVTTMTKKKSKAKPKVKVLKIEKVAPNKVAVALEVEDAPEFPAEVIAVAQPQDKSWMQWLRAAISGGFK